MKRIMQGLKLARIAAVDRPCQEGARVTIMKRDDTDTLPPEVEAYLKRDFSTERRNKDAKSGAAMPGGGYPIENGEDLSNAVQAIGRAKNPAKTKAHIISRARSLGATSTLPDSWNVSKLELLAGVTNQEAVDAFESVVKAYQSEMIASDFDEEQADAESREYANGLLEEVDEAVCSLRCVFNEIADDESGADKQALLQESFDQFKAHLQGIVPEGVENAMAALALVEAGFTINEGGQLSKREEDQMAFDIKKSLGLPATATDADVQKALDLNTRGASLAVAIFKMSGKHAAFMQNDKAKMPAGGKEAFADMSADERDKHMEKNPIAKSDVEKAADDKAAADEKKKKEDDESAAKKNDEVLKVGGVEIRKSVVGEGPFAVMKAQQADIAKLRDKDEVGTIEKRVAPLVHIGKADEIAGLLHSIAKHDPKLSEAVEKKLTQLEAMIGKGELFSEKGRSGNGVIGKAADSIEAAAKEIMAKGQAKSIFKARDMARTQNPDLAKQEEQERKDGQKAQRAA
jgi:hypothetical protein